MPCQESAAGGRASLVVTLQLQPSLLRGPGRREAGGWEPSAQGGVAASVQGWQAASAPRAAALLSGSFVLCDQLQAVTLRPSPGPLKWRVKKNSSKSRSRTTWQMDLRRIQMNLGAD